MKHNVSVNSPPNLMAVTGLALSAVCVMGWTGGCAMVFAPVGLVLSWLAFGLGAGGRRHALTHGFGGDLANFAMLFGALNGLAYSAVSVAWSLAMLQGMRT